MFPLRLTTMFLVTLVPTMMLRASDPANPPDTQLRDEANMASTYVPIESWVYPAFDRLAAEGYAPSGIVGLRPWTRLGCAHLVEEAQDRIADDAEAPADAATLLRSLSEEFAAELRRMNGGRNLEFRLESVDQRSTTITGRPLTDGYHFAETIVDNYGRPFGKGENSYSGLSFHATAGPFAVYARGEIQRVP
jgi:hypothetical protein